MLQLDREQRGKKIILRVKGKLGVGTTEKAREPGG